MRKTALPLSAQYMRVYRILRRAGHSSFKTIEIMYDAKRGDKHALQWIKIARSSR